MPDLNSVPSSPHALALSRRQSSQQMPPPPPTNTANDSPSLNILPSNQNAVNQGTASSSSLPSPQLMTAQPAQPQAGGATVLPSEAGVGSGPGPLRHPRPLTATELHMQLEKEQEAVVNRLTRELSLLRAAHNASVASNTSSTSAGTSTHDAPDTSLLSSGFTIPASRRHQRTSSSTSQTAAAQLASSYESRTAAYPSSRPPQPVSMSRQDSAASRHSQTHSPAQINPLDPSNYFQQQRIPLPTSVPMSSMNATPGSTSAATADQMSPGLLPATSRYEETAYYRKELDTAKKENDALKKRIRELEKLVRDRRNSDASRTRSESTSTTASVHVAPATGSSIAPPRDAIPPRPERERGMTTQSNHSHTGSVAVGVPEDEVQVGESASSAHREADAS